MPTKPLRSSHAFTLLEMLVATGVLALTLALVGQIASSTMSATQFGNRHMDVSGQVRTAFDRLGANLAGMVHSDGVTMVVAKDVNGLNDSLAFIADTRTRKGSVTGTSFGEQPRYAGVAFKIGKSPDPALGNAAVDMLHWGTATPTWGTAASTGNTADNLYYDLTQGAAPSIQGTAVPAPSGANSTFTLGYRPIGSNIFRFEISFVLDDGTIVNKGIAGGALPSDVNYPAPSTVTYLALSRRTALKTNAATNGRYVKALIVGMAAVSSDVRQLLGAAGVSTLATQFPNPSDPSNPPKPSDTAKQTPLQVWDFTGNTTEAQNLRTTLSKQNGGQLILNNTRVYERYFYVN